MEYLIISLIAFFVSALTLFSGFGLGTLLMPAFAFFFPLEVAVAATAIVHLSNNLLKVVLVGRGADWKITLLFALPAALAAIAGALLLGSLGQGGSVMEFSLFGHLFRTQLLKFVIGTVILLFAILELAPGVDKIELPPRFIPVGGLLSGFFGGLSGHQGALRSMFLIRAGLSKQAFIGTTVLSAVIVDVTRLLVYGTTTLGSQIRSLRDGEHLLLVVVGTLAAMAGSIIGKRLIEKVTLHWVQRSVGALLLLIGTGMILGVV